MVRIGWTYDSNELGWVSERIRIEEPIYVVIKLSDRGRVAVKKSNTTDGDYVNVLTTPISGPTFEFQINGETVDKCLEFVTSVQPEYIEIWGDMEPVVDWYCEVSTDYVWLDSEINSQSEFNIYSNTIWKINL